MRKRFSDKKPGEIITVSWDFRRLLEESETITAQSVAVTVVSGVDPDAAAMISGAAQLVANSVVAQRVVAGLNRVDYRLDFTIDTSAGRRYTESGTLPVRI
jgi:hypothetical protein